MTLSHDCPPPHTHTQSNTSVYKLYYFANTKKKGKYNLDTILYSNVSIYFKTNMKPQGILSTLLRLVVNISWLSESHIKPKKHNFSSKDNSRSVSNFHAFCEIKYIIKLNAARQRTLPLAERMHAYIQNSGMKITWKPDTGQVKKKYYFCVYLVLRLPYYYCYSK